MISGRQWAKARNGDSTTVVTASDTSGDGDLVPERTDVPVLNPAFIALEEAGGAALRGWRCGDCGHLAYGIKRICPLCASRAGRETRLADSAVLQTWTSVPGDTPYVIGY